MRILCLQHADEEGPGTLAGWAAARGHTLAVGRAYRGEPLPEIEDADWLVVLGGGMNVDETDRFPWLAEERRLTERAIRAGLPVLGICLGAQLVARALGAPVRRNPEPEIGWWPVHRTETGAASPLFASLADGAPVFQWHGDTFDLPDGSVRVARSEACENQAFVWGDRVVGVQFHPEMTPAVAAAVAELDAEALRAGGRWVQPRGEVLRDEGRFGKAACMLWGLLDAMERTAR